jgi:hypothetical protein
MTVGELIAELRKIEDKTFDSIPLDILKQSLPDDIRAKGWSVAVHNDYKIEGRNYTFWLFTKGNCAIKGEGPTDQDALNSVREQLIRFPIK